MFFLLQSELGDIYKVSLDCTEQMVHGLKIQYFDTIAPSSALNILTTGHLFAAGEASNHTLYNFKSTGDNEESPVICLS